MPVKNDYTQEWQEKIIGENYNNQINYYNKTDLCWRMYSGDQWVGIKSSDLPKFTLNICKQAVDFLIASIMSRPIKAEYNADNIPEPLPVQEGQIPSEEDIKNRAIRDKITTLNKWAEIKWEKEKMDYKLRKGFLLDGANSGDMAAHIYWNPNIKTGQAEKGDFCVEVIDGANVMFGDPNNRLVEPQPYILVIGRDTLKNLRKEAKANKVSADEIKKITSDVDTEYQIGDNGRIELEGAEEENQKATYVIKYWRGENGNIFWNKSVKNCVIRKDVDLGISRYPIAFGNWSEVKNSYHGNPPIYQIIPNQLLINQLFAMVGYWARMSAFGKVVIDSSKIASWSNKIGEVIKSDGSVDNVVKQLESGNFNGAVLTIIDMAIKYTKDFLGANEAALGQINPERASGTAIMLTAKQAAIPHANILANLTQFVEDLYLIWGEFFLKKYKDRTLYVKDKDGNTVGEPYSSEGMEDVLLSCKVNVGQSTIWNEPILLQNLDNLAKMGWIKPAQYYERIKTMNIIPNIQGLITDAKLDEMIEAKQRDLQAQIDEFLKTGMIPPQWTEPKTKPPDNGMNDPKLQGRFGSSAQNSLKASQPTQ